MRHSVRLVGLFVVLAALAQGIVAAAETPPVGNAGCLLRSGSEIVLVRDIWSRRYGLPGGTAEVGETAAQTAIRETAEETGLVVVAQQLLSKAANGFYIFDCEPKFKPLSVLELGKIPQTREAFNEIGAVVLKDPRLIPNELWRFPAQKQVILEVMSKAKSYEKQVVLHADAHPLIELELRWIQHFQSYSNRFWDVFFQFFSFLGGETFIWFLLAVIWFGVSRRRGLEIVFLLTSALLIHGILKQFFGVPRPFYFIPSLQKSPAEGFGFPSGHTLSVSLVWCWIAFTFHFPFRWVLAISFAVLGGLSRLYLGVHFIHDVVGAWLLALILASVYSVVLQKIQRNVFPLKLQWVVLVGLGVLALVFRFHPETVAIISVWLGLVGVHRWVGPLVGADSVWGHRQIAERAERHIQYVLMAFLGLAMISAVSHWVSAWSGTFLHCLIVRIVKYAVIGVWIGCLSARLQKEQSA
jgi:membrane-associated phospholipid phosphatase